jgi:hypothetical protein
MSSKNTETVVGISIVGVIILLIAAVIGGGMWGLPKYKIYKQNLHGQADLREAEWTKKISIETAKAGLASAEFYKKTEIKKAEGIAAANKIIGDSLEKNPRYLQYHWIEALGETQNRVIYVPTEGNMPILEAGKR